MIHIYSPPPPPLPPEAYTDMINIIIIIIIIPPLPFPHVSSMVKGIHDIECTCTQNKSQYACTDNFLDRRYGYHIEHKHGGGGGAGNYK